MTMRKDNPSVLLDLIYLSYIMGMSVVGYLWLFPKGKSRPMG